MTVCRHKLTMYDFAVFRVCIRGMLDESWSDYFGTQSVSTEIDDGGVAVTTFTTEAVDQSALGRPHQPLEFSGAALAGPGMPSRGRNRAARRPG